MTKIVKKIAAVGAAVMMMASISAMGASATDNPYTYGSNPVVHGYAIVYSGSRETLINPHIDNCAPPRN